MNLKLVQPIYKPMRYRSSARKTINQDEWVEGPLVISFDVSRQEEETREGEEGR